MLEKKILAITKERSLDRLRITVQNLVNICSKQNLISVRNLFLSFIDSRDRRFDGRHTRRALAALQASGLQLKRIVME